jgi:hypothetical protein
MIIDRRVATVAALFTISCGGGGGGTPANSVPATSVTLPSTIVGTQGSVIADDGSRSLAYVAIRSGTSSSIAVIDVMTGAMTKTLSLPANTNVNAITVDPSTGMLYLSSTQGTFPCLNFGVSTLDPSTGTFTFYNNGASGEWMAVDQSTHDVYAWSPGPSSAGSNFYVLDGTTLQVNSSAALPGYIYPGLGPVGTNAGMSFGGGGVAVDSTTHKVFLFGSAPPTGSNPNALLTIVDGTTNQVSGTPAAIPGYPMSIDFDPTTDSPVYGTTMPDAAVDGTLPVGSGFHVFRVEEVVWPGVRQLWVSGTYAYTDATGFHPGPSQIQTFTPQGTPLTTYTLGEQSGGPPPGYRFGSGGPRGYNQQQGYSWTVFTYDAPSPSGCGGVDATPQVLIIKDKC